MEYTMKDTGTLYKQIVSESYDDAGKTLDNILEKKTKERLETVLSKGDK